MLLGAEPNPPYDRPPLSKEFLRGEVGPADIALRDEGWAEQHGVRVESSSPVVGLDPRERGIRIADGRRIGFERCLLATGARPATIDLPGAESGERVAGLRTPADSLRAASWAEPGARILVVGSGFIGCEAAVSLAMRGAAVTLLSTERLPQVDRLGEDVAGLLAGWLEGDGVELRGGSSLEAIESPASGELPLRVHSSAAEPIDCDAVLLALGITRNTELASEAGLAVGTGILTDASMRASAPGIWAAGDVAEAKNATFGDRVLVEHWGEALEQGAVAGAAMAGAEERWTSVPGFWSMIGERTLKFCGWGGDYDEADLDAGQDGFSVAYRRGGRLVGVLAHERDEAYERGQDQVASDARANA